LERERQRYLLGKERRKTLAHLACPQHVVPALPCGNELTVERVAYPIITPMFALKELHEEHDRAETVTQRMGNHAWSQALAPQGQKRKQEPKRATGMSRSNP